MNDIDMLLEALHQSPFDQVTYLALADAYEAVGDMTEAESLRQAATGIEPLKRRTLRWLIRAKTDKLALPVASAMAELTEGEVALVFRAGATGRMKGKTCQFKPKTVISRLDKMVYRLTREAGVEVRGAYYGRDEYSTTFKFQEVCYNLHNMDVEIHWDQVPDPVLLAAALKRCVFMAIEAQSLSGEAT